MRSRMGLASAIVFVAGCLCSQAQAGDPKTEADRCLRWLDAFFHGQTDQAALIATEQLRPGDVPDIYLAGQRNGLQKFFQLITKIGTGAPTHASLLDDVVVAETGDIIKLQVWQFGANTRGYVGCVSYPGIDDPWHLVVKFGDDQGSLTAKLAQAAKSRVSSPPERSQ